MTKATLELIFAKYSLAKGIRDCTSRYILLLKQDKGSIDLKSLVTFYHIDVDAEGTNRQRQASERLQRVPSSERFSEQIESRTPAKPSGNSKSSRSASVCYLPCSQVGRQYIIT